MQSEEQKKIMIENVNKFKELRDVIIEQMSTVLSWP